MQKRTLQNNPNAQPESKVNVVRMPGLAHRLFKTLIKSKDKWLIRITKTGMVAHTSNPILKRLRKISTYSYKFKSSLSYVVSSRSAWTTM